MTLFSPPHILPSVYDPHFEQGRFDEELARVHAATAIERSWMDEAGLQPYNSDEAILEAADNGRLVRVSTGIGYAVRPKLALWTPDRSSPDHEHHYSPPFVVSAAHTMIEEIGREWQSEMGDARIFVVTSLVRSEPYQARIASQERKLTVRGGATSSHQVGISFDIDAIGLYETDDDGNRRAVNPDTPGFPPGLMHEARLVQRSILDRLRAEDRINYIEELPGTRQHCFHVCVNPLL